MFRVVSHSIPLGSNWARSMGTLPAPSPVRFSPRPDGYWPPEPWCSRGDGRLMCGVYGAVKSIDIKSQWTLYGNSMCQWKPNIHYIFLATVDLHIHTHTAGSTRFLALNLAQSALSFNKATCLFSYMPSSGSIQSVHGLHRLNVSPTFGSWSCRRSASTSWSAWSNRQTAPSDAVWSRVLVFSNIPMSNN